MRHKLALLRAAIRDAERGGGRWAVVEQGSDVRVTVDHPDGSRTMMVLDGQAWAGVRPLLTTGRVEDADEQR